MSVAKAKRQCRRQKCFLRCLSLSLIDFLFEHYAVSKISVLTVMQQMFLRYEILSQTLDTDLRQEENRRNFHTQVLHDILEV